MKNVLDGGAYIEGEHSPGGENAEQGWESGTILQQTLGRACLVGWVDNFDDM
jgi:hypothetical protein